MTNRFTLFADNGMQQPEADPIALFCDASLDEGDAIIRADFTPSIGSNGEEYFIQADQAEIEWMIDCLTLAIEGMDEGDHGLDTLIGLRERYSRAHAHIITRGEARKTFSAPPKPRKLVVTYDVTGLSDDEVSELEFEAMVQAERSKPQFDDQVGHPSVPVSAEVLTVEV
jgi:hypothetical protein